MRRSAPEAGFTLLEVMVALAILATSLIVLLEVTTNNVRATNHAKLMTAATFLARGKMVELETDLIEKGFGDIDQDDHGNFDDQGMPKFRWDSLIERVELPSDGQSKAQQAAGSVSQSSDPMQAMTGLIGGLMSSFMDPIRIGLQESVRRVTLRVTWDEVGRAEQALELVMFMTDPAKLDMALPGGGQLGATPPTGAATPTTGGAARPAAPSISAPSTSGGR